MTDSVLYQVTMRQLATKTLDSNSWFGSIMKLAYKYQLPSPHLVFQYKPKKLRWKKIVNQKVQEYWQAKLTQSARGKATLPSSQAQPTLPHESTLSLRQDSKLASSRTPTHCNHTGPPFYKENPTCKLCEEEAVTCVHMLSRCTAISHKRSIVLEPLLKYLEAGEADPPDTDTEIARLLMGIGPPHVKSAWMAARACSKLVHLHNTLYTRVYSLQFTVS